ncbi:MAG: 4Fe-4S dicluster domain-containing protein [Candidatus Bathyarchaeota archaeon]|nr:4Fe-4S dicluster domain-containing protein [Candidatus Bathyarchaeota archaeon]
MATIYIMGKAYKVPNTLTIMKAIEYVGYRFIRSCGCRGGFCGACTTFYRVKNDYKLQVDLACQKRVEDGMYIVQLPFIPAEKPKWDLDKMKSTTDEVIRVFPEITRCLSCNVCTQACPQDIEVMRAIQALRRGDLEDAVNLTFDCISCGACSIRCPAEITHYQVFQLARRLFGKYETIPAKHLMERVKEIEEGKFDDEVSKLMDMNLEEIKELYKKREIEK